MNQIAKEITSNPTMLIGFISLVYFIGLVISFGIAILLSDEKDSKDERSMVDMVLCWPIVLIIIILEALIFSFIAVCLSPFGLLDWLDKKEESKNN